MITIERQPQRVNALYANNVYEWSESGTKKYTVTLQVDIVRTFEVFADNDGRARIDMMYIARDYLYPLLADPTVVGNLPNRVINYHITIASDNDSHTLYNRILYWGAIQAWQEQDTLRRLLSESFFTAQGVDSSIQFVHRAGDGITRAVKYMRDGTSNELIIPPSTETDIYNIPTDSSVESVFIEQIGLKRLRDITPDSRYESYTFRYVNASGGTDIVSFTKASTETLDIDRSSYDKDNKEVVYDFDIERELTAISCYMSEEESRGLASFWMSKKIVLLKDGKEHDVVIDNKKVSILRKKQEKLLSYKVTFRYADKVLY